MDIARKGTKGTSERECIKHAEAVLDEFFAQLAGSRRRLVLLGDRRPKSRTRRVQASQGKELSARRPAGRNGE